jgi:hypothetical protein
MHPRPFLVLPLLALLAIGCNKKSEDPVTPPPGGGGSTAPPFQLSLDGPLGMRMQFGSNLVTFVDHGDITSYFSLGGVENSEPTPSTRYYEAGMVDGPTEDVIFSMTIGTVEYEGVVVTPDLFDDLFEAGNRPFVQVVNGGNGVELSFRDGNGQLWSTRCGSGAQGSSVFELIDVDSGQDLLGVKARVVATFVCNFHNCSTGEVRQATNGGLVLDFREF